MTRKRLLILLAMAVAAGAFYLYGTRNDRNNRTEDSLTLYGNVDIREVALSFRVGGRLDQVAFDEGDAVAPGDAVASIDAQPYLDELAVAEARVASARVQLRRLEAGSRPQEIDRARAEVAEARSAFGNAVQELDRKRALIESGATSQRELDVALARHGETAARLDSAQEALALAEEGFRPEDVEAGRVELALARAQLDQIRTRVADTRLVAPSPGVVLTRVLEPGSIVAAGAPVVTLSLSDTVYVRAYVSQPQLGRAVPGLPVTLETDSSERTYQGQVGFVSPRAEFTPRSVETPELRTDLVYRLRILVLDPDDSLRQGMPVTVHLPVTPGKET